MTDDLATRNLATDAGHAERAPMTLVPQESEIGSAAADDPEALWDDYQRLRSERRSLIESQAQHDIHMLVAIARLHLCHGGRWAYFLGTKKLERRPQAKSDFHPLVMDWLGATADRTGRATVCCTVLDEWTRTNPPMPPAEIPKWLKERGGPDGIYRAQRRAQKKPNSTRDEKDAAIHKLIELGPIASFDLPIELAALDGDHTMLVHLDSIKRRLDIKGLIAKVDQPWLRQHSESIVALRSAPPPTPTKPTGPVDEFMTKPEVSAYLYRKMLEIVPDRPGFARVTRWLEPAAGAGAFFNLLPPDKRLGIDIAPKTAGVVEHDFLTFTDFGDDIFFTISNPPFSKGAAIRFFNHAARVSAYIAFVVAPSFENATTLKNLDPHFHLISTLPVPDMAFLLAGKEVQVETIFQIWERRDELRKLKARDTPEKSADLEFLPSQQGATYIMQNLGENAGRSKPLGSEVNPASHFFIRCNDAAIKILNSIKWPPRAIGAYHLTRSEIIKIYNLKKRQLLSKFVH